MKPRTDWNRLDKIRRTAGPLEVDLVEAYASGRISRRNFVKRGAILGLSAPVITSVITACGSDDSASDVRRERAPQTGQQVSETTSAPATTGTTAPVTETTDVEQTVPPETTEAPEETAPPERPDPIDRNGLLAVAVLEGDANTGLDPVNMLDLGTYSVVAQQLDYLVGVDAGGGIAPTGLATGWQANDDATVWTFDLREGVTFSDGSLFTSADVAATMDRAVLGGSISFDGLLAEGAVDASDPARAVFTLARPDSNFPVFVSMYAPSTAITPADYSAGTTLDERAVGTGAWVLTDFNPAEFIARFEPNPGWWGGAPQVEALELRGFRTIDESVAAMTNREVDVIQRFTVEGGANLALDRSFETASIASSVHRQVWFNTVEGQFTDNRVRQALALSLDRSATVLQLFNGEATVANDHPIHPALAFFDPEAVPQRERDIASARRLLDEAGIDRIAANISIGNLQEIPDLAASIQRDAEEAGFDLSIDSQDNSTFYGDSWCPGFGVDGDVPCQGSAELGIVDYGHRPTPDVVFSSALATGGPWNASNYSSDAFDEQLVAYRSAVDVDTQTRAASDIQRTLHDDTPVCIPYFINYLAGHDDRVSGVGFTPLGHVITHSATLDS